MTDTDKPSDKTHKPTVCDNQHRELKRLAEAWKNWGEKPYADAILALIAENERLKGEKEGLYMQLEAVTQNCFRFLAQRDEAVALLREIGVFSGDVDLVSDFLARIDAAE